MKPLLVLLCMMSSLHLLSQQRENPLSGTVQGKVIDTALNFYLKGATISAYSTTGNRLIAYTMTNSVGEFTLKNLPINGPLRICASFIGYEEKNQLLTLDSVNRGLNIGTIRLDKKTSILDSVIVTPPPVRMHGDTLEFSAAAFELDKNAVGEDLLKKLPGVIVWGDGTITVNGKQISKLLVDGKPFFGGEARIATQNIPKEAIDKVQVYREFINPNNPLDSVTDINIKLRKNFHQGYFGIYSAGLGSNEKSEYGANNNLFNSRTQLAAVAQYNNINKSGNNIATLIKNNTYKGNGARVEYQPDFTVPGENRQASGGLSLLHDLVPEYNSFKQHRYGFNSFLSHNFNNTEKSVQTVTSITADSAVRQQQLDQSRIGVTSMTLGANYIRRLQFDSLRLTANYATDRFHNDSRNSIQTENAGNQLLGKSSQNNIEDKSLHAVSVGAAYDHHGFTSSNTQHLTNWNGDYAGRYESGKLIRQRNAAFLGVGGGAVNLTYKRNYDNNFYRVRQSLTNHIGDFAQWLFGKNRLLSNYHLQFENDLTFFYEKQNNNVSDWDTLTNRQKKNDYLTNTTDYTSIREIAGIKFGRSFNKILANRYQKDLEIYAESRMQLYNEHFWSTHAFQEFSHRYHHFLPGIQLAYSNFQYGDYLNQYQLGFSVLPQYPTPDQRTVLADSSDIYAVRQGNYGLHPQETHEILFRYRHDGYRSKNTLSYGTQLTAGTTKNYLADSIMIDQAGRYAYYITNLNGQKYVRFNAFLNKAFLFRKQQFQILAAAAAEKAVVPGFIGYITNGKASRGSSEITTSSDSLSIYYSFGDIVALQLMQRIQYFRSTSNGSSFGTFSSTQTETKLGLGISLTKKLSLNSNIAYNRVSYTEAGTNSFCLWNIFASYRFLKGNNLECKLSALDVLNQNRGIVNFGNNYSYTNGTVNLLHRYLMATVSFYPRKFGTHRNTK